MVLSSLFIIKCIIQSILLYLGVEKAQIMSIIHFILIALYIVLIIFTFLYFNPNSNKCFDQSLYPTIFISAFYILGFIYIALVLLKILTVSLFFPILIYRYKKDPARFYEEYGLDPQIIDNMPSTIADYQHSTECTKWQCVICSEDIIVGEPIFILNCDARHYFHEPCIKSWLKVKISCPLCRTGNVI